MSFGTTRFRLKYMLGGLFASTIAMDSMGETLTGTSSSQERKPEENMARREKDKEPAAGGGSSAGPTHRRPEQKWAPMLGFDCRRLLNSNMK
jgi:hypothetical protein